MGNVNLPLIFIQMCGHDYPGNGLAVLSHAMYQGPVSGSHKS